VISQTQDSVTTRGGLACSPGFSNCHTVFEHGVSTLWFDVTTV
jgi:hypothetical protein